MPYGTEITFGNFYKSDVITGVNICTTKKLQFSPDVVMSKPESYLGGQRGAWIKSS